MENKELLEEVAREIFIELYKKANPSFSNKKISGIVDFWWESGRYPNIELKNLRSQSYSSAEAALSVIAPHYEKQIAELKAKVPQWLPIKDAPKDGSKLLLLHDLDITNSRNVGNNMVQTHLSAEKLQIVLIGLKEEIASLKNEVKTLKNEISKQKTKGDTE